MSKLRRPTLALAIVASLSLAACDRPADPAVGATAPADAAPAAAKPMLGSFGFDASGMDRSIAAGDDFFGFANGTWVKNTEIPADRSRFGSFNVIAEKTLADTRAILEGPPATPRPAATTS
jgi:putative endopeptidase